MRYDYTEVAALAAEAIRTGQRMNVALAAHYGITHRAATEAISQARKAGHPIPSQRGWTQFGPPGIRKPGGHYPCGTTSAYRMGCRCTECRAAHRESAVARRMARHRNNLRPIAQRERWKEQKQAQRAEFAEIRQAITTWAPKPGRPVLLACDCGHETDSIDALTRHTLTAHRRPPTRAERTPRTESAAA